ncbi:hypothetical protein [Paenibacillus sp. 19GGS1-52]|nr:hypothetical protein [Paenibacillus sp. 19GGS1-52]
MGYKESLLAILKNCAQKTAKKRYCEISHIIFENTPARLAQ